MLVKMFNLAELWEMRPPGRNPCKAVRRYKVAPHKERFLTPDELARLGQALDAAPAERLASRHAAAAIRLLVVTGCRRSEILGLRWANVDFDPGELVPRVDLALHRIPLAARGPLDEVLRRPVDAGNAHGGSRLTRAVGALCRA